MEVQTTISNMALIWGNLRNNLDFSKITIPGSISLVGTNIGEFPVETYHPIFLELNKEGSRLNLLGRHNWTSNMDERTINWFEKRLMPLPEYVIKENIQITDLKRLIQTWSNFNILDNVPFLNMAVSIKGSYCPEGRESQLILVLLLWASGVSRIFQLDYFEGALDDCCTPEWYIKSSMMLTLSKAISKLLTNFNSPPAWDFPKFSIFLNPSCFNFNFKGKRIETCKKSWKDEWVYENFDEFYTDLQQISELLSVLNY